MWSNTTPTFDLWYDQLHLQMISSIVVITFCMSIDIIGWNWRLDFSFHDAIHCVTTGWIYVESTHWCYSNCTRLNFTKKLLGWCICCKEVRPLGVTGFYVCNYTCFYGFVTSLSMDYLRDSWYITVYKQAMMFILTVGCNSRSFLEQDVIQHSGKRVSCHFQVVLCALAAFVKNQTFSFNETPSKILKNIKYYPGFKDCVSAINRTHVPIIVPMKKPILYRSAHKKSASRTS